jgi:hypothetical protein
MMRRKKLLAATLLSIICLMFAIRWDQSRPSPGDQITRENFKRLREGMTRAEVEAIRGVPPGDYTTGPVRVVYMGSARGFGRLRKEWLGDNGHIEMYFSEDDWYPGARRLLFDDVDRFEQTRFENLSWRLKRQWRKWFP